VSPPQMLVKGFGQAYCYLLTVCGRPLRPADLRSTLWGAKNMRPDLVVCGVRNPLDARQVSPALLRIQIPMAPNVPSKIGKYDVLGVIGHGGMGVVYKAVDPRLDRQVAIKMMTWGFVDDPNLRKRFFREAQSLASLQHPNIVTVYDLGDYDGNPYLVMQYMEGETLDSALVNKRKLSFLDKLNIVIQVCNGLAYAHRRFVVHRDIKPANIMLEKDGGIKIFDFGIAHVGVGDQSVTKTGQIIGTPPYMSPEQINGKIIDARSDLFSLGVVLYQLCADHLPFQGDSPPSTFLKILYEPPAPLKTYLSSFSPEFDAIIERALAKDPIERYGSADEFALDLGHVLKDLREEVVGRLMREVGELLERAELPKAKDLLLQVLRTDPQHVPATQTLRDVERRIKKEEISEQVRRLRQQADECVARQQWESAQSFLEQALALHKTDTELRQHVESVRLAVVQARKLREVLKSAETAHNEGDLDIAKQAIEEAVQIAPDDTQAKALYRVIQREWLDRTRQRQVETYLFQARQHISARNFNDAIETLKLAEALDPGAPQIHALIEMASGRLEQERRHKQIQAEVCDIESALNKDDYQGACQKAAEALARFPEERTIIKLKALAERQRQIEARRRLVEEQLVLARHLLQVNRNEELLASLEATLAKIGPEARLQSLLSIVTENVERDRLERRKSEYLQRARDLLRNQQYDSAIHALEAAPTELRNEPELDELLRFVKEEAAGEKRRREAGVAVEKARAFVAEQKYDEAIHVLESILQQNTDPDLRVALEETRRAAAEYQERMTTALESAEKLMQARKFVEVVKLLESQPTAYLRNPAFSRLLEGARNQADRMRRIREAIDQSQHLCDDGDYPGAHRILKEWRRKYGNESELDAQDALIEQRRTEAARQAAEKAMGDARTRISAGDFQAGLDKLQAVAELVADLPEAMATEYRSLRQVAATGLVDSRKNEIEQSIDKGELTRAGNVLQQALVQFPGEQRLSNLGKVVDEETTRRSAAQRKLAEAQNAFDEQLWNTGGELLAKAFASSSRAPAVRAKVIDAFVHAAFLAVETDWRAADALLKRLARLNPDYDPPSLLRLQIREYEHEETVGRYAGQANALIASGRLQEALDRLSDGLKALADDVTLLELRKSLLERIRQQEERARQDRARLEKEALLSDVVTRVEQETRLERRITILEEAQLRFPQEPQLLRLSVATKELIARISSITAQAHKLEEEGKYDEALAQWNVVRTLHARQTELDDNIDRVTRLRDQRRARVKAEWVAEVRGAFDASDFERTQTLLREAAQEFPQDQELMLLEAQLRSALKARGKAEEYMADATKAFERLRWGKGIEALRRLQEIAPNDAVLKNQSLICLAKASEAALALDIPTAHMLLDRAAMLARSSPLISDLERKIKEREREESIVERLTSLRRSQKTGDLEGARLEVNRAIKSFPEDARLLGAKQEIEQQLQQLDQKKAQELENSHQRELKRDRQFEKQGQDELERDRARQRAQEEEERLRREQAASRERLRAEEAERKRQEDEKRERLRAEQLELERKESAERERIRAEEIERKRLEDEQRKRLEAERQERERKEAAELERIRAEEAECKRREKFEKEKALAQQREEERKRELERLKALEWERLEAEKRRLEEKRRLKEEALEREEKVRRERELAKKQDKERKAQENARKREERERLAAETAEKRKQEQEAERLRKEQSRPEPRRHKQEALKQKERRATESLEAQESREEIRATILMSSPAQPLAKASAADVSTEASAEVSRHPIVSQLTPGTRSAVYLTAAIVLLGAVILAWRALVPHTIAIKITTTHDGATVTITSKDHRGQEQKCVTPNCSFNLRPGKYSVEAKHEGYENAQKEIEVDANLSRTYVISLLAPPPPPPPIPTEMVVLKVRGLTGGSELFVDGKSMGRAGDNDEMSVKVPTGSHEVKVLAKDQNSSVVVRNFIADHIVSLTRDDLFPRTHAPEDLDWQSALVSGSIDSVERFLKKYPSGTHQVEAVDMLENKYWERDLQANSVESYRDFLQRYSQGSHAATAREELAFLTVGRNDSASLDAFVKNFGNSRHRTEIDHLRDELAWQRTKRNEESSLVAYLALFPAGSHAAEAKDKLANLRDEALWARTNRSDEKSLDAYLNTFPEGNHAQDATASLTALRDESDWERTNKQDLAALRSYLQKFPRGRYVADANTAINALSSQAKNLQAIKVAIERYRDAYESESPGDMGKAWPSISKEQLKAITELFNRFSAIKLRIECQDGDIHIGQQQASAFCQQSARYTLKGKVQSEIPSRVNLGFKNLGNGIWVVESVSSQ
jgi:eukaryotic-like serine/threonine-protein kinase